MPTIFTKIIQREIPAYIIAENEYNLAFLDINPLQKGHTLVIPKEETDQIFDLPPHRISELHTFAQKIAIAQKKSFVCNRIALVVLGLEVPHAHIHLIPINKERDIDFSTSNRPSFDSKEMEDIAKSIIQYL